MFEAIRNPYLVSFDGSFKRSSISSKPPKNAPNKAECRTQLRSYIGALDELQRLLYAHNKHAILLVFQAMDAAGKDSTIRAVMSGVNPAGCQVFSFKQPSSLELEHDFLWRTYRSLPERGRIGIFNRSYYEEVLVVRVHPEYLEYQQLPELPSLSRLWKDRYQSILDHEEHLARNGTIVLKFWLNVSKNEQRKRFLSRIDEPEKNWKFSEGDVRERGHWNKYMNAYQQALAKTSRPWAPWYAIPADNKPFMRMCVAKTIVKNLQKLEMNYPKLSAAEKEKIFEMRALLES